MHNQRNGQQLQRLSATGWRGMVGALLTVIFVTVACGSAGGDAGGGGTVEPRGELLTDGSGGIQTLSLTASPEWQQHFEYVNAQDRFAAANPATGLLHVAITPSTGPFRVETYNLDSLEKSGPDFTWPDTELSDYFRGLAFSPDGTYAAAIIRRGGQDELSVISVDNPGSEFLSQRHFRGNIGPALAWISDTELAFSLDVRDQAGLTFDGAIVPLDVVAESENPGSLILDPLATFTDPDWQLDRVPDMTVSPDASLLAFTFGHGDDRNLYVLDLTEDSSTPRQLTMGGYPHVGAAFSPDGRSIAFIENTSGYQAGVFTVTVDGPAPLDFDDPPVIDRHLMTRGLAHRILAWR